MPPSMHHEDVIDAFARVQRIAADMGINSDRWVLEPGVLGDSDRRRTAWAVNDHRGRRVFTLGFTMRSALDILTAIANAYELAQRVTKA